MAICKFCGQEAGFLHKEHNECHMKYDAGKQKIMSIVQSTIYTISDFTAVEKELHNLAQMSFISENEFKSLLITAWTNSVTRAFEDNILTKEEENSLASFRNHFSLSQGELDKNGAYSRVVKGAIIRELLAGNLPQRVTVEGSTPFNFQKNETLIWIFQNVQYYEQNNKRQYVGGYSGVSVRVAKGLYFHTGGFKGAPINTQESVHADTGILAFTDKHIYFGGNAKGFKIAYDKIVSFTPYTDGVGVQRDASTARPQIFKTGDGWFTYNLLTLLAKVRVG